MRQRGRERIRKNEKECLKFAKDSLPMLHAYMASGCIRHDVCHFDNLQVEAREACASPEGLTDTPATTSTNLSIDESCLRLPPNL